MSLVENLRVIKQGKEDPIFKIERDRANAALKEAMLGDLPTIIQEPRNLEATIRGKINSSGEKQQEVGFFGLALPLDQKIQVEYQFSGKGTLLKRQTRFNSEQPGVILEKPQWEVVQTPEINLLTLYITGKSKLAESFALGSIWSGSLKLNPGESNFDCDKHFADRLKATEQRRGKNLRRKKR